MADRFDLLEAMHIRLRHFAMNGLPIATDLTFIFQGVTDTPIEKPKGACRSIYGLTTIGDIVYCDAQELLYIDWGNGFKAICHAGERLARITMPKGNAKLHLATHTLFNLCLFELLKRHGLYHIHAAGLCSGGQGLLFRGVSGAGKSTLTVALLRAGFDLLGDDTLFLTQGEEGIRALAFPDEIDVTEQTLGFFPELPAYSDVRKKHREKAQVEAERIYQTNWIESCIPRLLVFPRVANTATSVIKPIDPEQALMEMAANIMLTENFFSQAHLDALGGLIRQCGCYRLETGRDFDTLPNRLRELLG
jgi:hypothetical protein